MLAGGRMHAGWEIKDSGVDLEFVSVVGEAI